MGDPCIRPQGGEVHQLPGAPGAEPQKGLERNQELVVLATHAFEFVLVEDHAGFREGFVEEAVGQPGVGRSEALAQVEAPHLVGDRPGNLREPRLAPDSSPW